MKTPVDFYKELGTRELAARKKEEYTVMELQFLIDHLPRKGKLLDVGCGYGRFAIPLTKHGYHVIGIDITPSLIEDAQNNAEKESVDVEFLAGDMRDLQFQDNSLDIIICMWSAFAELVNEEDQVRALKEMDRVLNNRGFALLEMAQPRDISVGRVDEDDEIIHVDDLFLQYRTKGIEANPNYRHTAASLLKRSQAAGITKAEANIEEFGGRPRLILTFRGNK